MPRRMGLTEIIDALAHQYGPPAPPDVTEPFEMILWENVAYLVGDDRRRRVWERLRRTIGVTPQAILRAPEELLLDVIADGGMQPERRAEKLRTAARFACEEFDEDLQAVLERPLDKALRALKKFPGIGEPGAEKIMLFTRTQPVLALESNGLRVLLRLGLGQASDNYAAAYRSVRRDIAVDLRDDFDWLIAAHQLLRQHGQTLCKRSDPQCGACPLAKRCPSGTV